ncbi:hypothetical protein ANO11243_054940 [Dothideomycetidae sp. 11243]|nr:hypothetical protein ANO11243_054940 [fungal sp. No.11243]
MASKTAPGEQFEVRQTSSSEDWKPDPSKSLPLSPARQALVDDIIALYSCEPTIRRVERYTPDCVYDDQFVYANDLYKMAGQWFALPKLFNASKNEGYQIVKNDKLLIQFRNEQSWTFKIIPKTATINALVSLSLDPDTVDSDFIKVKYHKDQANDKDYSHEGSGFTFKKWQADQVAKHMDSEEGHASSSGDGPLLAGSLCFVGPGQCLSSGICRPEALETIYGHDAAACGEAVIRGTTRTQLCRVFDDMKRREYFSKVAGEEGCSATADRQTYGEKPRSFTAVHDGVKSGVNAGRELEFLLGRAQNDVAFRLACLVRLPPLLSASPSIFLAPDRAPPSSPAAHRFIACCPTCSSSYIFTPLPPPFTSATARLILY